MQCMLYCPTLERPKPLLDTDTNHKDGDRQIQNTELKHTDIHTYTTEKDDEDTEWCRQHKSLLSLC